MTAFSTPAVSEAGKAIALAVAVTLAVVYVPVASFVAFPLLPLPVAFVVMRRGARVGLAAAFAAGALATMLTGPVNGLMTFLFAGLVAVSLGMSLERGWGVSRVLLATTASAGLALVAWAGSMWVLAGLDAARMEQLFDDSLATAMEAYRSFGMAEETVQMAAEELRSALDVLPYLLPSIVGVLGLGFAAVAVGLSFVIYRRMGEELPEEFSFTRFRMHWSAAYGFIAGLGLLVAAPALGSSQEAARLVGLNLLIFFQTLFFLQGLAVVHWYVTSRRLTAPPRVLIYTGALLGQAFLQLVSWAGLLDTWFDYRTRFAPGRQTGRSEGSKLPGGDKDKED